jgi:hypothetical protein
MSKRPRKKYLSQDEIVALLKELDDEIYADSDSDCEIESNNLDFSIEEREDALPFDGNETHLNTNEVQEEILEKGKEIILDWKTPNETSVANIFPFTSRTGLKCQNLLHSELDYFKLFFNDELIEIVVNETNKYAEQNQQNATENHSHSLKWTDTNPAEIHRFFALTLLMGHIEKDTFSDYWSTNELIETPIFGKIMSRDRYLHILKYLHFCDNTQAQPDKSDPNYDRLWKMRNIFDLLNKSFKIAYDPTEEISVDEVIVKFKGRVLFKQYIPKKHKRWGMKIYKLCDKSGYTYHMEMYLGKDKNKDNPSQSASHSLVMKITECIKDKGHKLYMDNFFSSPKLFMELFENYKINSCGTMRPNRKFYPKFNKTSKKKERGNFEVKFANGMTALKWTDKRDVFMLTNMHNPQIKEFNEKK